MMSYDTIGDGNGLTDSSYAPGGMGVMHNEFCRRQIASDGPGGHGSHGVGACVPCKLLSILTDATVAGRTPFAPPTLFHGPVGGAQARFGDCQWTWPLRVNIFQPTSLKPSQKSE